MSLRRRSGWETLSETSEPGVGSELVVSFALRSFISRPYASLSFSRHYFEPNPMPKHIPPVAELGVTSAPLKSASFHLGSFCKEYNGRSIFPPSFASSSLSRDSSRQRTSCSAEERARTPSTVSRREGGSPGVRQTCQSSATDECGGERRRKLELTFLPSSSSSLALLVNE